MCMRSEYDLYARMSSKPVRTPAKPARSLVELWRDLFRRRRPQAEPGQVVPFPAGGAGGAAKEVGREGSKAA